MLKRNRFAALCALALAGSLAAFPAAAAEAGGVPGEAPLATQPPFAASPDTAGDQDPLTRGELVALLYEWAGRPEASARPDYLDVDQEAPYAQAVAWAVGEGLVSGYGDGRFGPEDEVTREQMAVILYRCAQSRGQGFTGAWAFPLGYSDGEEISEFAYEAVCWVTMKQVMGDTGEGAFAPRDTVTRQQAGAMLERCANAAAQTQLANPFVPCQSLEQAAQVAGFSLEVPLDLGDGETGYAIRAEKDKLIEVMFQGEAGRVVVRKGLGQEEISGDYRAYPDVEEVEWDGRAVELRGEGGAVMVAVWRDAGYTYAILAPEGLERDQMAAMGLKIR